MKKKILILSLCLFMLSGCTQVLKDSDNKTVTNDKTGQSITENIICRPTDEDVIKIYEENDVDLDKLPECTKFNPNPTQNYEGIWTSVFVKPLAWVIINVGSLINNYGLAIILTCLIIRLILMPITKKTAMQSELMKKAQPELQKLEVKYQEWERLYR